MSRSRRHHSLSVVVRARRRPTLMPILIGVGGWMLLAILATAWAVFIAVILVLLNWMKA